MKSEKFSLNMLFHNNKFLFVFSLLVAFGIWLSVAINYAPEEERVIENVPVNIEVSQAMKTYGLSSFGEDDYKVDVTVKGKRYDVSKSALTADDISVKADTSRVNAAGRYTLQLVASSASDNSSFEITSISMNMIDVYFDVAETKEFQINRNVIAPSGVVEDGYYLGNMVLSESTVKVSGPETEIDKITGVNATVNIDSPLTASQTFDCNVAAYNSSGNEPEYLTYKTNQSAVTLTVPVYKIVTLSTGVNFVNSPSEYISSPPEFTVYPSSAQFGVAESRLDSLDGVMPVAEIDFSELESGRQTFTVEFDSESAVLIDDSITEFTVTVDTGDMTAKDIEIPASSVTFENAAGGVTPSAGSPLTITVYGPADSLENIDADSVTAKIDASAIKSGDIVTDAPVTITLADSPDCWVYGTYTEQVVA